MLKDNLDIFLITYNRRPYLEVTLNSIFAQDSPLNKYPITILDNNSNDGTEELCRDFATRYQNLTYIKNKKNVGLSGNICKALENASRKYYWIICDNDEIDFTSWPEIEKAMEEDYDLIMTSVDYNCDKVEDKRSFALAQSTFLPACIYKTEYLTDDVLVYALTDIHTILPHVCVACNTINHNGKIYIPKTSVITLTSNVKINNLKTYSYDRVETKNDKKLVHARTMQIHFPAGIVASFDSLEDKHLREEVIVNLIYRSKINDYGPFLPTVDLFIRQYIKIFSKARMKPYIWKQFIDGLPFKEKCKAFFWALFFTLCPVVIIRSFDKYYYVRLFGLIKTKIPKIAKAKKATC